MQDYFVDQQGLLLRGYPEFKIIVINSVCEHSNCTSRL